MKHRSETINYNFATSLEIQPISKLSNLDRLIYRQIKHANLVIWPSWKGNDLKFALNDSFKSDNIYRTANISFASYLHRYQRMLRKQRPSKTKT